MSTCLKRVEVNSHQSCAVILIQRKLKSILGNHGAFYFIFQPIKLQNLLRSTYKRFWQKEHRNVCPNYHNTDWKSINTKKSLITLLLAFTARGSKKARGVEKKHGPRRFLFQVITRFFTYGIQNWWWQTWNVDLKHDFLKLNSNIK